MVTKYQPDASPSIEIDRQLQHLLMEARRHPHSSLERQKALNKLLCQISKSGKIGHPQQESWPPGLYKYLHDEAVQKTLLYISQNLEQYKPEHPVMAWFNQQIKYKFIDAVRDYKKQGITNLPKSKNDDRFPAISSLDMLDIDKIMTPEEKPSDDAQMLRQLLEDDPDGLFRQEHIKNRPEANFQALAQAKFCDGDTYEDISQKFGVPISTLSTFLQRKSDLFTPYLREHLQD